MNGKQCLWPSLGLPLGIGLLLELLKNGNDFLQSLHLAGQLLLDLRFGLGGDIVGTRGEGLVEVLVIRSSTYGHTEDLFHNEIVVLAEGNTVGFTEGAGKLLTGLVDVAAEGLGSEVKAPV